MQIGFKVWQEILKGEEQSELYYSFYNFFMFGAFFIVLKVKIYYFLYLIILFLQKQNLHSELLKLNKWIKTNNINLNLCQLAEKAIINYCPKIKDPKLDSASIFIEIIYNQIIKIFYSANSTNSNIQNLLYDKLSEYKNISLDILQFSFSEYDIYFEYNQIIIALASCLVCAKQKENENFYQNIIYIIKNLKIDYSLIEKCMYKILNNLNSEDNSDEDITTDEESPGFNIRNESIITLTKKIENDFKNIENKKQN